jgi:single-stranded-DNA-specific exonuclease
MVASSEQTLAGQLPPQRWQIAEPQPEQVQQMATATGLSPLLAQVLCNRDIHTPEQARLYLNPEQQELPDPCSDFPDLQPTVDVLKEAIAHQHPIVICGDYDADGMTSTALLLRALRNLGAIADYAIPSRMSEGYGINQRIVEDCHQQGVRIILTVDNGIAAAAPIARARELGLTVIVTDHHDVPPELPPANTILNPKLIRPESPYRGVAGVGVAYILAVTLTQQLQPDSSDLTKPLLALFTLGTIADLAPLTGVNRRWVRRGLGQLPISEIPGIQALIQVAGLSQEKELKPEAIGFRLGPRINAVGRIADPQTVIDLLTTDDMGQALQQAMVCEQVNQRRQQLCETIEQEAIAWCEIEQPDLLGDRVLVVVQPGWHHGVIGIVASRLLERYGVPVFIGTYEEEVEASEGSCEPAMIRGSARGIPEFDVFESLQACSDLLEKFGGHQAAGGFSLKSENLTAMHSRLAEFANQVLQPQHLKPLVKVDVQADLADLTLDLYRQIDQLHPCGIANPDPVFWTPNVRVIDQQAIGKTRNHLKLTIGVEGLPVNNEAELPTMKAIAWRWGEYCPLPNRVDLAYRLRLNEWQGKTSVELEIVGARLPEDSPRSQPTLNPFQEGNSPTSPKRAGRSLSPHPEVPRQSPGMTTNSNISNSPQSIAKAGSRQQDNAQRHDRDDTGEVQIFYASQRRYRCKLVQTQEELELRLKNPEGSVLYVQSGESTGTLKTRSGEAQAVDLSHAHYQHLIRTALQRLKAKPATFRRFGLDD